jgi:RecB family exonuclease
VGVRPLVLLVPSLAAAVELPRRLASTGRALAGLYPLRLLDLARAIAEPALLGRGLKPWSGAHAPLVAARLLDGPHALRLDPRLPRGPVAAALARTLTELRGAGLAPSALEAIVAEGTTAEDEARLRGVADLYRGFHEAVEARFADPATLLRRAAEHIGSARWLEGADLLVVEDLELGPLEAEFLAALARRLPVKRLDRPRPAALAAFASWAESQGIQAVDEAQTIFAPGAPVATPPAGLTRLQERLFAPAGDRPVEDDSVALLTAPGEAAEVRSLVRRLLQEAARGVAFEEMAVILPRPDPYALLVTDLLARLEIPHRLHPSLPLRAGRCARALLLLLRCRGLYRAEVMEFLTFAPVPYAELLGDETPPRPARWDTTSREAGIVSGYERWLIGLRAYAEEECSEAQATADAERQAWHRDRAAGAEALLRVVELLHTTLVGLDGEATWAEWSERLLGVLDQWIGPERDRQAVVEAIADLAGLGSVTAGRVAWPMVEDVLETLFDWERLPMDPLTTGGVHVGSMDALAGLPFRVVAIPGLVEGGFPGVLRPDPFLLDAEREALRARAAPPAPVRGPTSGPRQLSLFDSAEDPAPRRDQDTGSIALLATTQDRLVEARAAFHRALSQATERLILSYPRADPRSGRERLPSLFFVAAASALAGRPLGALDLAARVVEDELSTLPLEDALDASERDRARVLRGGAEAVLAIAAGAPFFKWSHLAAHERWSSALTAHDGLVSDLPADLARRLDPRTASWPVSASSLATYAKCGFQYALKHVLRLRPLEEPQERLWLDALEQGRLFHEVAEIFLRGQRDSGALPVRNDEATRQRLLSLARERVEAFVAGRPPRHRLVWQIRWAAFEALLLRWLAREATTAERSTPAYFEVSFGLPQRARTGEPHHAEPLAVDLGEGRCLRLSGQIDRIDVRPDGALVLRDYKTGRAPKDDGSVFRGGRELQIPVYVLATRMIFPDRVVAEAFLDYVNGGRPVPFDPASVAGETFRRLLREITDAIAAGQFVQEPSACVWCELAAVCGPQPLVELRQRFKIGDARVQRYLRLREYR